PRARVRGAGCARRPAHRQGGRRCPSRGAREPPRACSGLGRLGRGGVGRGLVLLVRLLLLGDGLTLGVVVATDRLEGRTGGLLLRLEERRRGGLALELLPVAGLLQDG